MKKADIIKGLVELGIGTAGELDSLTVPVLAAILKLAEQAQLATDLTEKNAELTRLVAERDELLKELNGQLKLKEESVAPGDDTSFSHNGQTGRFLAPRLSIGGKIVTAELARKHPEVAKLAAECGSPLIEMNPKNPK